MSTLLQTLYCASGRTRQALGGISPTEDATNTPSGTHDANDGTLDSAVDSGDNDTQPPNMSYIVDYVLDTASAGGTIDFVRVLFRHIKSADNFLSASARPYINGTARGTADTSNNSTFANVQFDFATDPDDSAAWTNSKINAKRWGFRIAAQGSDPADLSYAQCSEYKVEVWGTAVQTSTPGSIEIPAVSNSATGVPGAVSAAGAIADVPVVALGSTGVPGLRVVSPESIPVAVEVAISTKYGGGVVTLPGDLHPEQATSANPQKVGYRGSDPDFLMLSDDDATTYFAVSKGRPPDTTGTMTIAARIEDTAPDPLGGAPILHILIRAIGQAIRYTLATLTNPRVVYGDPEQTKALTVFPIHDTQLPYLTGYRDFSTDPITTRPDGQPWTWADVIGLGNVDLKLDFSLPAPGTAADFFVHEVWAEVYRPVGAIPDIITLRQPIGAPIVMRTKSTPP